MAKVKITIPEQVIEIDNDDFLETLSQSSFDNLKLSFIISRYMNQNMMDTISHFGRYLLCNIECEVITPQK